MVSNGELSVKAIDIGKFNLLYFISFIVDRYVDQIRRKFPDANFFRVKINTSTT